MIVVPASIPPVDSRGPRPRIGRNTRLTDRGSAGFAYSASASRGRYPHPFKPVLIGQGVSFSRGLVETFEPTIGGVPISGNPSKGLPAPVLRLDATVANDQGESWCCLQFTPNQRGQVDGKTKIEIVHTAQPLSREPEVARTPVALILWRERQAYLAFEILYFNVRYQRVTEPSGPPRHVFF